MKDDSDNNRVRFNILSLVCTLKSIVTKELCTTLFERKRTCLQTKKTFI